MNRREAVQHIAILLGGAMVGANALLTGCKTETGLKNAWQPEDIVYLDEIAETILPATATPGAKAAQVGQFMTVMVDDCYEARDQEVFRKGMGQLNDLAKEKFGNTFLKLDASQRHQLLVTLDAEQKGYMKAKKEGEPAHYFRMMKELTLLGFFTSEVGMTKARRYEPVPGSYNGCVPYKKGDKAFA